MFNDYDTWRRARPLAMTSLLEYFTLIGRPTSADSIESICAGRPIPWVYQWLLDQLPTDRRLLDKTPAYATSIGTLHGTIAFSPFYIWLIRHPLGVVDSYLRVKRQDKPLLVRAFHILKDRVQRVFYGGVSRKGRRRESLWVVQNSNIRTFLSSVPELRQFVVIFEDLLENPRSVLEDLCRSMGLTFEQGMLDRMAEPPPVTAGLGDPNFLRHKGITTHPIASWRKEYRDSALSAAARAMTSEIWAPRGSQTHHA